MLVFVVVALLTITFTTILTITYMSLRSFKYWKSKNVYTLQPKILFGNARDVILQKKLFGFDIVELYNYVRSKSKKYGGYYLFFDPVFVPTDLNLIKKIMISDFNHFTDRVSHVDDQNDPLSANLLFLHGDRWKYVRELLRPCFSSKIICAGMGNLQLCTDNLMTLVKRTIAEEKFLDVKKVLDKYTIDVIGALLFNVESNALTSQNSELENNISAVLVTSITGTAIRFLFSLPNIKNYIKLPGFNGQVTKFFMDFVQQHRGSSSGVIKTLTTNTKLKNHEVAANAAMMFLAGYDTTSNTATFLLYELALNSHLQDAVRREIFIVLDKDNGVPTYNALADMVLLEKCLRETLRKYPVSTILSRMCVKTYAVPDSDIVLEKGSQVYIPVRAVHWDSEYYPNPEIFNPERFSEEEIRNRHPCAWMPFSVGSRHCIGYKLAKISIKMAIVQLLRHYRFSVHSSIKNPIEYDPNAYILQAKDAIKLCAVKINDENQLKP